MRMSQKALAHLSSAFIFDHYARNEWDKGADVDKGKAKIWEDIRDAELKAAGLPDMDGIVSAAAAIYRRKREAREAKAAKAAKAEAQARWLKHERDDTLDLY